MKTAFAYVRVSTLDQERQGNSIPEQLLRIEDFAHSKNIQITKVYQDSSSAYHDENREDFNRMITDAMSNRPNHIIVDDSSRFSRTRDVSSSTKKLLKKYGITVLLASEENINPNTSSGLWLEGIREIKNEAHSMDISYNTIRGMSGNIKNRDKETGWCYKNGGRPAYGYITIHLDRGINSKGKPIIKSIWELHPENAKHARMIIIDLYGDKEMSYDKIRNYLNNNNIPSPTGKPWSTSTIVEMLSDYRLEQYAGTACWNKENRQTNGSRFKPKEEWIKVDNAHPAIITKDELENLLYRKTRARNNATAGRTGESPYLFTGKNLEDQSMFVCSACGGNIIGYRNDSNRWRKYVCGTSRYKGEAGCTSKYIINQEWLENTLVEEIKKRYTAPERIEEIIQQVKIDINAGFKDYHNALGDLSKKKNQEEVQLQRLLDAVKAGFNPATIAKESNELQIKIDNLESKIRFLKNNPPKELAYDKNEISGFFTNFSTSFDNATIPERRRLIRTFVRHLEMDPEKEEIRVSFYPDNVVHSIGGGGGSRTPVRKQDQRSFYERIS